VFFTDEACALAAGHRPCASCRRDDHRRFLAGRKLADVDAAIRAERTPRPPVDPTMLPDGAMVERDGDAWLVWHGSLHRWAGEGYDTTAPLAGPALLLTPPTTVELLCAGYVPQVRA
jgi:hypothetical protein